MYEDFDEEANQGWLRRNATGIATLVGSVGVVVGLYFVVTSLETARPTPPPLPTIVNLQPPPPPPPPEIKQEEPPPEVEAEAIIEPEVEQLEPLDEPEENLDEPPPGPLGLDAEGSGSGDAFGLVGQKGGTPLGRGGGGGDLEKWYSGVVQLGVSSALRRHEKLRFASFPRTSMHIWVDAAGRIVRVELLGSTGDAEIDRVLTSDALQGVTLPKAPPARLLGGEGGQLRITVRTTAIQPDTG